MKKDDPRGKQERSKTQENMKDQMVSALISALERKTLEQITVKEIAEAVGVSRQTFYYYFHDIYDIVEWVFESASSMILAEFSTIDSWQIGYVIIMQWVQNHRLLVLNCYRSVRKDYIENFMNRVLFEYIHHVVEEQSKGMQVTEEQKKFIAKFFTLAINAISLEWIGNGMKEDPDNMAEQVNILIRGDFKKALQNFERENSKSRT